VVISTPDDNDDDDNDDGDNDDNKDDNDNDVQQMTMTVPFLLQFLW
jgi:hypothetical protein